MTTSAWPDPVGDLIRTIRRTGIAIILVEHDLHLAFGVADTVARGRVVHRAGTAAFRADPDTAHRPLGVAG